MWNTHVFRFGTSEHDLQMVGFPDQSVTLQTGRLVDSSIFVTNIVPTLGITSDTWEKQDLGWYPHWDAICYPHWDHFWDDMLGMMFGSCHGTSTGWSPTPHGPMAPWPHGPMAPWPHGSIRAHHHRAKALVIHSPSQVKPRQGMGMWIFQKQEPSHLEPCHFGQSGYMWF